MKGNSEQIGGVFHFFNNQEIENYVSNISEIVLRIVDQSYAIFKKKGLSF